MTKIKLYIIAIIIVIIIVILYYANANIRHVIQNMKFLFITCKKGICNEDIHKCYSVNGHIHSSSFGNKIERNTLKCVLDTTDKHKLLKLENIFVPSLMNGTFCDIVYTTYYDYNDLTVLKNRINNLNMPITKCIRIRKYYFEPGTYFEVKYTGGTKIRTLIDDEYNLVDTDLIDEDNKEMIVSILNKIKSNDITPIFSNSYKRMSFIYKNNPSLRITIDSNIEFFHNNIYNKMDNDILEFKMPTSIKINDAIQYIDEINRMAGLSLKYDEFSKFEYYYYKVIMNQTY
jgi:hypothetical protein